MKVIRYNQTIRVLPSDDKEDRVVKGFLRNSYTYKPVRSKGITKYEKSDRYYYYINYKHEYVIIDTLMKEFFYHIFSNGISKRDVAVSVRETDTDTVPFEMNVSFTPRDEQPFFIDGMVSDKSHHRVIVEAETGYGKTYMFAEAISKINKGVLIYILPRYIDKWIEDIETYLKVTKDEICVIQGSDSLKEFMDDSKQYKIVIASADTMRVYFENTSNSAIVNDGYALQPDEFMEKKNLGIMLSDETHQSFNNIFIATMMLDPKRMIALSATLITKDSSLEKFHKQLFPKESRLALEAYKRFTIIENANYHIHSAKRMNFSYGYGYSHKRFEKFILQNKRLRKEFFRMVVFYIDKHYMSKREDGHKCLVYASSLDMIDFLTESLKKHYKDLDVRKYIGGSKYENALEPDIRVSHSQSLGAAIDIKGLIYTLNTINMDSISALFQMIGRLRENEVQVIFTQLVSTVVPQHAKYVRRNKKYLLQRVKTITESTYPNTLYA